MSVGRAHHEDVKGASGAVAINIFPAGGEHDPARVGRPAGHGVIPGPLREPDQTRSLPLCRHYVQVLVAAAPAPEHYLHMRAHRDTLATVRYLRFRSKNHLDVFAAGEVLYSSRKGHIED